MKAKANLRAVELQSDVTTTELFTAHFSRGPARVVADAPRRLVVAGVPVAEIGPDPSRLNPMCATSAEDMPVVEMLAAIASSHPSGVLVIESADAQEGFAFEVVGGNVTGARGPGEFAQVERWCAEVHRCYPDRFGTADRSDPLWIAVARAFVTERVLDHLELASSPGARLTFIRGDVTWKGTCLPEGKGIPLQHLLLEHARRSDELPRVMARLVDVTMLAVPLSEPPVKPTSPAKRTGTGGDGWDFFADPDPAALEEWSDARLVWPLCDGQHSLEEIVELALLGRFRGLAALATLKDRNHILLGDSAPVAATSFGENDIGELENDLDQASALVVPLRRAPTPAPIVPKEEPRTEYSVVLRNGAATVPVRETVAAQKPRVRATVRGAQSDRSLAARGSIVTAPTIRPPVVAAPPKPSAPSPRPAVPSRVVRATTSVLSVESVVQQAPLLPTRPTSPPRSMPPRRPTPAVSDAHRFDVIPPSEPFTPPTPTPTPARTSASSSPSLSSSKLRSRDVIDEMMAEFETPSPDDEPAFATPIPEPTPRAVMPANAPKPARSKATLFIAMAIAGATLFVAGAGVALHISRSEPAKIER